MEVPTHTWHIENIVGNCERWRIQVLSVCTRKDRDEAGKAS